MLRPKNNRGTFCEMMENWKEIGNAEFKNGNYKDAIDCYTKGIENMKIDEKPTLLLNRALCQFKRELYQPCIDDCTAAIELKGNREKALYRRAEGYYAMKNYLQAFKDVAEVLQMNSSNKAANVLARKVKESISKQESKKGKLSKIMGQIKNGQNCGELLLNVAKSCSLDKALCADIVRDEQHIKIVLDCLRHGMNKNEMDGLNAMCCLEAIAKSNDENLECIVNHIAMVEVYEVIQKSKGNNIVLNAAFMFLIHRICYLQRIANAESRISKDEITKTDEAIGELLSQVMKGLSSMYEDEVTLTVYNGLLPLLSDARIVHQLIVLNAYEFTLEKADSANPKIASMISLVYNQSFATLDNDEKVKQLLRSVCLKALGSAVQGNIPSVADLTKAAGILAAVFLVNREVGLWVCQQLHTMNNLHSLINSKDSINAQSIAMNAASQAAAMEQGKALFTETFISDSFKLMNSSSIRVRSGALTTYIKLAAVSKSFQGESVIGKQLLGAVFSILEECSGAAEEDDILSQLYTAKERAIEALSYLVHDTNVKEDVVRNTKVLQCIVNVSEKSKSTVAYGCAYILSHLMVREGQLKRKKMEGMEMSPEQYEELQKATKQESPFEDGDHDQKAKFRIKKVVEQGGIQGLCILCRVDSLRAQESAVQAMLNATENQAVHGLMVQQGAIKALVPLALILESKELCNLVKDNKELCANIQKNASQALSKLLITTNPGLLPSSRLLSTIKPLTLLLHADSNLLQFEALMALTNIASVGLDAKSRILADNGLHQVEYLQVRMRLHDLFLICFSFQITNWYNVQLLN